MKRGLCASCGHHHGAADDQWPSCFGYIYPENSNGIRRCACTGPETQRQETQ